MTSCWNESYAAWDSFRLHLQPTHGQKLAQASGSEGDVRADRRQIDSRVAIQCTYAHHGYVGALATRNDPNSAVAKVL